jgi:hypothetical protein
MVLVSSARAQVLNVFNCVEVHGEYYLAVDMRRKCASGVHFWEMMLGAVGVLLCTSFPNPNPSSAERSWDRMDGYRTALPKPTSRFARS